MPQLFDAGAAGERSMENTKAGTSEVASTFQLPKVKSREGKPKHRELARVNERYKPQNGLMEYEPKFESKGHFQRKLDFVESPFN